MKTAASPSARPLRILVADGDSLTRKIAARVLGREGHELTQANDSDQALDLLKGHGFDLALIGLDLAPLGGIDTAKLYRFMALGRPRMPIVGMASNWTMDASTRGGEAGIEHFLPKPLIPDELLATVAQVTPREKLAGSVPEDPFGIVTPLFGRAEPAPAATDPALLDRMETVGGAEFVAELVDDFAAASEELVAACKESLQRRSIGQLRDAGSRLDEIARTIGADRLRRMGAALAAIGATEFDKRARDYVRQVEAEHKTVMAELMLRIAPLNSAAG